MGDRGVRGRTTRTKGLALVFPTSHSSQTPKNMGITAKRRLQIIYNLSMKFQRVYKNGKLVKVYKDGKLIIK